MKTKNKLMAAVAMLVISTLMLTTASYAWFTISTAPEIKGLTTKVVTNDNLEIALVKDQATLPEVPDSKTSKTGDFYTWGNIVNLAATTKLDGNAGENEYSKFLTDNDVVLRPATYDSGFKAPTYGYDGRVNTIGMALTDDTGYGFGTLKGTDTEVYGYYVDFWVRTNVGGKLVLSEALDRVTSETTDPNGAGSTVVADGAEADSTFEDSMALGFSVMATAAEGQTTATAEASPAVVLATNTSANGANKLTINLTENTNGIVNMTANTAYLIRVYVYLEGENMTNADASITNTDITGKINLQFKLDGVTMDPMDTTIPDDPTPTP